VVGMIPAKPWVPVGYLTTAVGKLDAPSNLTVQNHSPVTHPRQAYSAQLWFVSDRARCNGMDRSPAS